MPEAGAPDVKVVIKQKKTPKRILHFSDGTLEEYSTDEDEVDEAPKQIIDPVCPVSLVYKYKYSFILHFVHTL